MPYRDNLAKSLNLLTAWAGIVINVMVVFGNGFRVLFEHIIAEPGWKRAEEVSLALSLCLLSSTFTKISCLLISACGWCDVYSITGFAVCYLSPCSRFAMVVARAPLVGFTPAVGARCVARKETRFAGLPVADPRSPVL